MLLRLTFIALALYGAQASAKDLSKKPNTIKDIDVVLMQDGVSIGVKAPPGWVLDKSGAARSGLCAVYVKNGQTFDLSPAIMYPRISNYAKSFDEGVAADIKPMVESYKSSKSFKLEEKPDYVNSKGIRFKIRDFLNGPKPNGFEEVGYAYIKSHIVLAVYSTQEEKPFLGHEKIFRDFLDQIVLYNTAIPELSDNCLYPDQKK